ncbi:MAG TPA: dephospho-CoA kinase [bacterium]|nr:dephospho-CoA kinase [bacterium]HPO83056.1 dephospho-CoA kinase [bacterium]
MSEITIVVTGTIGSGKSTVCGFFQELGAEYISSDDIAKRLIREDDRVKRLIGYFFSDYGSRDFVKKIFSDTSKRLTLNSITHPFVLGYLRDYKKSSKKFLVIEVPLYIEIRSWDIGDITVVTYAPEDVLLRRIMEKWNIDLEEAEERLNSQLPQEIKLLFGDYKIDTSISLDFTRAQVEKVWEEINLSSSRTISRTR